jgi:hypothetical protein
MSTYTFNIRNFRMTDEFGNFIWWEETSEFSLIWKNNSAWDNINVPRWYSIADWSYGFGSVRPPSYVVSSTSEWETNFSNSSTSLLGNVILETPINSLEDSQKAAIGWDISSYSTIVSQCVTFFGANFNAAYSYPSGTNFNLIIFSGLIVDITQPPTIPMSTAFSYLGNDPNYDSQSTYTF